MKKIVSLIVAAAVMMSTAVVFAENNADKLQETLVSVKSRIDIPEECTQFSSRTFTFNDTNSYTFMWNSEDGDKSLNVTAAEDGIITSYYNYEWSDRPDSPKMSTMSPSEMKAIAEEFESKINPDYPYETEITENGNVSLYGGGRSYDITIYINGVPLSSTGRMTVDATVGKVTSYSIWYDPAAVIDFESPDAFIGTDAAISAYKEKLGMELVYSSYYDYDSDKMIFYPAYVQKENYNSYINAMTGEKEDIRYNYSFSRASVAEDSATGAAMKNEAAYETGLSSQEIAEIDTINGLISQSDIEKQIKANKTLAVPQDIKTERVNLYQDKTEGVYYYRLNMSSQNKDKAVYVYVTANAKTGEIISFNKSRDYDVNEKEVEFTYRGDDILKALAGSKAGEYAYNEEANRYERYVNGIRVERDSARITLENGVLANYSITYSDTDFPSIDGVLSPEEAADAFFTQVEYKPMCTETYREDEAHIVPVYAYKSSYSTVNPFSGKIIDWQNKEITSTTDEPLTYSDISGHYAESYINALADYGIGFEGGEFKPNEKITQSALLTLLTFVSGGESVVVRYDNKEQADTAYSRAESRNIINDSERDDNAVITRETASIYLIRAIGAEQYAKYDDIYVAPYADVTENKGYIALLSAMGVVKGDNKGNFNPKREITRAEFAVMLYNYLNR